GPTRIGDNVWLGANVVVTSGVTIGERCVIGANSVVTQDVPPFSIAAGAPAKVLRGVTYERDAARTTG
ncbi:MAG TPA: DapH/DapD/GlmU-related protein, partial [Solirubrobacteraceae bacterium]|nr:DapH/DapD/GlmU-related protein [Solirubrobacteraceae bacterium]